MTRELVARAHISIDADRKQVWEALVDPAQIKQYMFGAQVKSDWRLGSPISWQGDVQGKHYKDTGVITAFVPDEKLGFTHYSALSGKPDKPQNYHNVNIALEDNDGKTQVELTQDGNASEQELTHAQENWTSMLQGLKKTAEH